MGNIIIKNRRNVTIAGRHMNCWLFTSGFAASMFATGAKKAWVITNRTYWLMVRPVDAEYAHQNGWDIIGNGNFSIDR